METAYNAQQDAAAQEEKIQTGQATSDGEGDLIIELESLLI